MKFHENPDSGSHDVPFGQTNGRTHTTKLTAPFRNYKQTHLSTQRPKLWRITIAYVHQTW